MRLNFSRKGAKVFWGFLVAIYAAPLLAQTSEQDLRDRVSNMIRAQLQLGPDQFLSVQRDESMVRLGAFIFRVSRAGEEIKGHSIIHHIFTDADPVFLVAVDEGGAMYRVHGFHDSESEFNRLVVAVGPKITGPQEAESLADFYVGVNPGGLPLTPISVRPDRTQAIVWLRFRKAGRKYRYPDG